MNPGGLVNTFLVIGALAITSLGARETAKTSI